MMPVENSSVRVQRNQTALQNQEIPTAAADPDDSQERSLFYHNLCKPTCSSDAIMIPIQITDCI